MIVSSKYTGPSARLLRDEIFRMTGINMLVTQFPERYPFKHIHIRYGGSAPATSHQRDTEYNTQEFIRLCTSKWRFSRLLNEHGIATPRFTRLEQPTAFPIVIRETLNSCGGRGIHVVHSLEEYIPFRNCYWTPFVTCTKEYRVHILGGKIAKVFEKIKDNQSDPEGPYPIRNIYGGYHFSLRKHEKGFARLKLLVDKLSEVVPGKFYAIDVGWDDVNKRYFVFEGNSAPGLNTKTVIMYAEYLVRELGLEVRNELLRPAEDPARTPVLTP